MRHSLAFPRTRWVPQAFLQWNRERGEGEVEEDGGGKGGPGFTSSLTSSPAAARNLGYLVHCSFSLLTLALIAPFVLTPLCSYLLVKCRIFLQNLCFARSPWASASVRLLILHFPSYLETTRCLVPASRMSIQTAANTRPTLIV